MNTKEKLMILGINAWLVIFVLLAIKCNNGAEKPAKPIGPEATKIWEEDRKPIPFVFSSMDACINYMYLDYWRDKEQEDCLDSKNNENKAHVEAYCQASCYCARTIEDEEINFECYIRFTEWMNKRMQAMISCEDWYLVKDSFCAPCESDYCKPYSMQWSSSGPWKIGGIGDVGQK